MSANETEWECPNRTYSSDIERMSRNLLCDHPSVRRQTIHSLCTLRGAFPLAAPQYRSTTTIRLGSGRRVHRVQASTNAPEEKWSRAVYVSDHPHWRFASEDSEFSPRVGAPPLAQRKRSRVGPAGLRSDWQWRSYSNPMIPESRRTSIARQHPCLESYIYRKRHRRVHLFPTAWKQAPCRPQRV